MNNSNENRMEIDQQTYGLTSVRRLFSAPAYKEEDRAHVAFLLHTILMIMISATLIGYSAMIRHPNPPIVAAALTILLCIELGSFTLLRLKYERASAYLLVGTLWLSLVGLSMITEGLANSAFFGLILVVTIASLTMGGRVGLAFAGLSSLAGLGLYMGKAHHIFPNYLIAFEPSSFWALSSVILLATAGMIQLATSGLKKATHRARENERREAEANRELQLIRDNLELLVQSRTKELEKRTNYLQATIEVSRAAASILDDEILLNEAVERIRVQFGLYYVGLFLLDPSGEWAILRAGTGEAGKAMISRGHRIRRGTGMIGWSIANAQPRIAQEVGRDAVRLVTPELPLTLSEAAFPLRARGEVIGALTIQSAASQAFGEMEISTYQTLADQIAIALANARLFSENRHALHAAQLANQQITNEAWNSAHKGSQDLCFRYDYGRLTVGSTSIDDPSDMLSLPIPLRDQVIGTIRLRKPEYSENWNEYELEALKSVVEQIGAALDTAWLYQGARRRAERERLTSEITTKLRLSNDPKTIMQTAIEELRKALQADQARAFMKTHKAEMEIASDE